MSKKINIEKLKKGCLGKIQHKSYLAATYYLETMHKKTNNTKDPLVVYQCKYCKFYHLGHNKLENANREHRQEEANTLK